MNDESVERISARYAEAMRDLIGPVAREDQCPRTWCLLVRGHDMPHVEVTPTEHAPPNTRIGKPMARIRPIGGGQ